MLLSWFMGFLLWSSKVGGEVRQRKLLHCLGQAGRLLTIRHVSAAKSISVQQERWEQKSIWLYFKWFDFFMQHPGVILSNNWSSFMLSRIKKTIFLTRMPVKTSWHFATQLPVIKLFDKNLVFLDLPVWWKAMIWLQLVWRMPLWKSWLTCAWLTMPSLTQFLGWF